MKTLRTAVDLTADDRRRIEEAWPEEADECLVTVEDGFLCARFVKTHEHFERIRRITGYLTGTLEKWNNAKSAEERDRVKHLIGLQDLQDSQESNPVNPENHGILSEKK
jgi:ribonucleoside-triphosphate reductase